MNTEFPKSKNTFLNAKDFQDNERILTYRGWDRKGNEDRPAMGKAPASTWKENVKYMLKYTYPKIAIDPVTGEKRLDKNGKEFQNSNYMEEYPHGYTIVYFFDEGQFESGSYPLYKAFMSLQPAPGETVIISKTGVKENTRWTVRRAGKAEPEEKVFQLDEDLEPDTQLPPF